MGNVVHFSRAPCDEMANSRSAVHKRRTAPDTHSWGGEQSNMAATREESVGSTGCYLRQARSEDTAETATRHTVPTAQPLN